MAPRVLEQQDGEPPGAAFVAAAADEEEEEEEEGALIGLRSPWCWLGFIALIMT